MRKKLLENIWKLNLKDYQLFFTQHFLQLIGKESITTDGHKVEIAANIGSTQDMKQVLENDAEAVGLYRSEFLYMNSKDWPSEETQFESYKEVLEKMGNKGVVIRILDIGGDKTLPYFKHSQTVQTVLNAVAELWYDLF